MSAITYMPMGRGERTGRQRAHASWLVNAMVDGAEQATKATVSHAVRHAKAKKAGTGELASKVARDKPRMHRPGRHRANRRR